jgi:hypothetical protein
LTRHKPFITDAEGLYLGIRFGKKGLFMIASGMEGSGMAGDHFSHSSLDFSFRIKTAPLVTAD